MKVYEMEVMGGAGGYISVLNTGYYYSTIRKKQRSQYRYEKLIFTTDVQISIEVPAEYIKRNKKNKLLQ